MRKTKASVLMVSYQYAPVVDGGAERQAQYLAEGLAERGRQVSVVTARYPGLPTRDHRGGVVVYRVCAVHRPLRLSLTFLPSLAGFLAGPGRRFDIWHVHQAYYHAGVTLRLGRLLQKPCVVKAAASGPFGDLARLRSRQSGRWVLRVLPRAAAIVSLNPALSKELVGAGLSPSHIRLIPNGVDCSRFVPPGQGERVAARRTLGLPEVCRVALFAGRLTEDKGVSYLLDAWRIVEQWAGDDPWYLLLAGDGEDADRYRQRNDRELQRARFLGKVPDMRPVLHAADVLVHGSLSEGMSNIVLEAMASGLAVVGSKIPGVEDLVEEGKTGMLVEPGDYQSLASALFALLQAPEQVDKMGRKGRTLAERRYSLTAMLDAYEELYGQLYRA